MSWAWPVKPARVIFNDPINATDPSGFISMSDVVKGFVTAGHVASAGLFAYGAITSGNAATTNFAAVGGSTGGSSALTLPGLQGQPGSSATVEDVSGNMAGPPPRSSLFDPEVGALAEFLCQFPGIATCDEAGVRMNLLIPDVPVGPVPVASQTASWWGRLKNWLFGRAAHRDLRPKCQSD